ncbi:MAG: hypothetical protein IE878_04640 [Epsilonproteobacteria bacterium]|nr:hypothetical protein [Campylobacterota bacterium]
MSELDFENIMDKNLNDFEIARIIKSDIRSYHLTLDEVFKNSSGKDFFG